MDVYLTFVGRGLEHVLQELILESLSPRYSVSIEVLGNEAITGQTKDLSSRLEQKQTNRKKRRRFNDSAAAAPATATAACSMTVGSFQEQDQQHLALGYNTYGQAIWASPGSVTGFAWVLITTNASPILVGNQLRFLGPLLALVDYCDGQELDESKGLLDVCKTLKNVSQASSYNLEKAVDLWRRHVSECWPQILGEQARGSADRSGKGGPLSYRLSCVRPEKKNYKFKRQDLMAECAGFLVPNTWKVNLKQYDLEIVLFLLHHSLAIAITLRPYRHVPVSDFSNGQWPSDITPPNLTAHILGNVVRLRPSTAQILLYLASLAEGEVVLDPCVGIGTIPVEAQFLRKHNSSSGSCDIIALGGDLLLAPERELRHTSTIYTKKARQIQKSRSVLGLFSWDACRLPFRSGIVDAVVSDLPFGQSCLSSAKLNQMLPLILSELARVLVPGTGRMVLLCGSCWPVLEALHTANQSHGDVSVWRFPCSAVFPVNIGGLLAWIIQVDRANGSPPVLKNYDSRIRKILERRDIVRKSQVKNPHTKQKRPQS